MSEKDDELTYDELHLAIKIFRVLYWIFVCLLLIWFLGIIIAVFRGFEWYFALPTYIVGAFILRVGKRMCLNIIEGSRGDIDHHERPFEN